MRPSVCACTDMSQRGAFARMSLGVLHCYADYKWTGPSEPVAVLCRELSRRGVRSELACAPARGLHERYLSSQARRMGVRVHDEFYFDSSPDLEKTLRDIKRLSVRMQEGRYEIVHAHGSWDHVLAAVALRRSPCRMPLLRTDHGAREYDGSLLQRLQFGPLMTDHLIVLSDRLRARAVDRLGLAPEKVTCVRGAVDVSQYRPFDPPRGIRERFGLSERDLVFTLVARVQRYRRFGVLLRAARTLRRLDERIKILVLGRGTHRRGILDEPMAEMGLEDTVRPVGYRDADYRQVLAMADAGLMLVPGSDGSCRAAMQMAAMGKPLVVAERGVLPDIVADGETGIVVYDTPAGLAEAILEMAESAEQRRRWGKAARERMENLFSIDRQADELLGLYQRLLDRK